MVHAIFPRKKVTYLLGAGASAGAIPPVKDMPKRLGEFVAFLQRSLSDLKSEGDPRGVKVLQDLNRDAAWLYGNLVTEIKDAGGSIYRPEHDSIDAFAQILSLRQNGAADVRRMKVVLSLFFVYEHDRWRCDTRYKSLVTTLLKLDKPNIKILTWNYDACFEYAYQSVVGTNDFWLARRNLNMISKNISDRTSASGFSILQLNGSANFHNHTRDRVNYREEGEDSIIDALINGYYVSRCDGDDRCETLMSYGWEPDGLGNGNSIYEHAQYATQSTDILVVIGYSFPDVNRDHDELMIQGMHNLGMIVVQDPEAASVIGHIKQITSVPCQMAPGNPYGAFYVPRELSKK